MNNKSTSVKIVALGIAFGAAASLGVAHVRAAGIPATGALTYTGWLETAAGAPVDGTKNLGLEVFDAESGGSKVCEVGSAPVPVARGKFQLPLPDACTTAVQANPNLWVAVQVDGASLGRTRLGAVPYAVVAASAEVAARANALGTLQPGDVQRRVSGTCPAGQSVRQIAADGTVACEPDRNTTYSAGPGLALSGSTFALARPKLYPEPPSFPLTSPVDGAADYTTPVPHAFCSASYVRFPADAAGSTHWCTIGYNANGTWTLQAAGSGEPARCGMWCL